MQGSPIDATAVLSRAESVLWMEVDDEIVVYDPRTEQSVVLGGSAGLLWQCLDGVSTIEEIALDMAEVFALACGDVVGSLLPVAEDWIASGLAETGDHQPG
jgi:hypothetical protein